MDYQQPAWRFGLSIRFAKKQTRVDDDPRVGSGLDAQQTPGFAVVDAYSRFSISKQTTLKLGVSNLFNKTYAYHVNRANVDPFNPQPVQVNEPGRAFWFNIRTTF